MHKKDQPGITEFGTAEDAFPYEIIFNTFPDIIFIISTDGYLLNFKAGSNAPFPFVTEDWLHKNIEDVLPADIGKLFRNALQKQIATGKTQNIEYKITFKGKDYWYEARLLPTDSERI